MKKVIKVVKITLDQHNDLVKHGFTVVYVSAPKKEEK